MFVIQVQKYIIQSHEYGKLYIWIIPYAAGTSLVCHYYDFIKLSKLTVNQNSELRVLLLANYYKLLRIDFSLQF